MASPTPRQLWADAVWEDTTLSPHEKLVALLFAKFAGKGIESVFVSRRVIQRYTGIGRTKVNEVVTSLDDRGWLDRVEKERAQRAPRYRLRVPDTRVSCGDTLDESDGAASVSRDGVRMSRGDGQGAATRPRTTKGTTTSNPRDHPQWSALVTKVIASGLGAGREEDVVDVSAKDPETDSPVGRLVANEPHFIKCVSIVKAADGEVRRREREAAPRCHECGRPVGDCNAEAERVGVDARCRRHDEGSKETA